MKTNDIGYLICSDAEFGVENVCVRKIIYEQDYGRYFTFHFSEDTKTVHHARQEYIYESKEEAVKDLIAILDSCKYEAEKYLEEAK